MAFKIGDIVQLKSGGAPLTVSYTSSFDSDVIQLQLTCISSGGLLQETTVCEDAVKNYYGT